MLAIMIISLAVVCVIVAGAVLCVIGSADTQTSPKPPSKNSTVNSNNRKQQ